MTPQEKATELIEKFYQQIIDIVDVNNAYHYAKQCAAICVQEMINCTHSRDIVESAILKGETDKYCYEYWNEVLKHINQ